MHGLNSRDPVALLRYEATRRPEIAALLARVHELTEEEIDNAQVPLPWYRQALKSLQKNNRVAALIDQHVVNGFSADPEGEIVTYTGDEIWVTVRSTQLLLKSDTLLFFPTKGGVWIETLFIPTIDQRLLNGRGHGKGTRQKYREMIQAKREGMNPPQFVLDPQAAGPITGQPLAHLGVRIQR